MRLRKYAAKGLLSYSAPNRKEAVARFLFLISSSLLFLSVEMKDAPSKNIPLRPSVRFPPSFPWGLRGEAKIDSGAGRRQKGTLLFLSTLLDVGVS